jgi:hypothetical protein
MKNIHKINQHIYITNGEEIKEGDYILIHGHYKHGKHITKVVKITDTYEVIEGGNHSKKACQRIILTTDQKLIKDGIQAIDDEFIEWFIKNPNCEEVEVKKKGISDYMKRFAYYRYEIIIPQEEHKQGYTPNNQEIMFHEEHKEYFYEDFVNGKLVTVWLGKDYIPKEEPKQETTLEEVAERLYPGVDRQVDRMLFIKGAKWQQEQDKNMYSEDDLDMFRKFMIQEQNFSKSCLDVFIEQFKKK